MACLEEEAGVERNWYPASQPCWSLDATGWIPKAASDSHGEKAVAADAGYERTLQSPSKSNSDWTLVRSLGIITRK